MNLKNAQILVIGGTSGIGLGVASAVAERGATPIVASRRQSSVDRALAELPEGARGATVDLTDQSGLDRLAADIGDIEHLVFTAGEPRTGRVHRPHFRRHRPVLPDPLCRCAERGARIRARASRPAGPSR